jgi:dTDP-4-dehydrorhamnose reductase
MLATDVDTAFGDRGWDVRAPVRIDFDVCDRTKLEDLRQGRFGEFDWIVNCAAYTNVDRAETETMAALAVNGTAPGALAALCAERAWRFLHVSTDYVYDGAKGAPYVETDEARPLNTYGRTKLFGDKQVMALNQDAVVLRTAWLFGRTGKSFPRTIVQSWVAGQRLRVVDDQVGSPTSTIDLARVIVDVCEARLPGGLYHAAGPDHVSWHGFAVRTLEAYRSRIGPEKEVDVEAVTTADWPATAVRPKNSSLDSSKLWSTGIEPIRGLDEALEGFVASL